MPALNPGIPAAAPPGSLRSDGAPLTVRCGRSTDGQGRETVPRGYGVSAGTEPAGSRTGPSRVPVLPAYRTFPRTGPSRVLGDAGVQERLPPRTRGAVADRRAPARRGLRTTPGPHRPA
ncbi:hypothetical protein GCM10010360_33410 [Streptomyces nogalater]